jgi:hypothetical protein
MSLDKNKDWSNWLPESDGSATTSGTGSKRQTGQPRVKLGGVTPVSTHVQEKPSSAQPGGSDQPGVKGYDRNTDPVLARNRPGHIDYPQQGGPSNPQTRFTDRWTRAGNDMESSTKAAQERQSGNYKQRKT